MAKRGLLLCFDAFGTLFCLKNPIERQYGDVARRQFGLSGFDDRQLREAFRAAFKAQSRVHPNYGRTSAMGAAAWWTQVIHATFRPFVREGNKMPAGLAPQLLARFASSEGYTMDREVPSLLRALKQQKNGGSYSRIVVGVITNSDDRVPGILTSFGLRVSPLRYGTTVQTGQTTDEMSSSSDVDIDFHCMSYDVGVEKPDPRIFRAAETLLPAVLSKEADLDHWDKIYVGDEARKDVAGAQAAGWHPVLVLPEGEKGRDGKITTQEGEVVLRHLHDCPPQPLGCLFGRPPDAVSDAVVVGVDSIASLFQWMLEPEKQEGEA